MTKLKSKNKITKYTKHPIIVGANIALEFSSGVIVGIAIGYIIDKFFNTQPIFIIIFMFLGFIAGLSNLIKYIKKNKL